MTIRIASQPDLGAWAGMRSRLWPGTKLADHRDEAAELLGRPAGECIAFLDAGADGALRGFAEATLRHDHVNGCETSPVAFLEGIFVRPEDRGRGIGAGLLRAVRGWARERGCTELGSDALLENLVSHAFHRALGFEETERVVFFRLRL